MRGGIEARGPVNTPAREERDPVLAEEPGGALSRVARILVFGCEQHERTVELLVEGREQERQRRFRHPSRGGKRVRKRGQALALTELLDERVQDRLVHDERPNPAGSATVMVAARLA